MTDLGWDDVSFHGNQQIPTPNLDALAKSGITLEKNYVQPACSPTRASLLTGRHVINTGVYSVLHAHDVLSSNFTLLPQFLSDLGYSCHAIGKWHLGKQIVPILINGSLIGMVYCGRANQLAFHSSFSWL